MKYKIFYTVCRSPHGERGLKSEPLYEMLLPACRSPHGERGLKYAITLELCFVHRSLSSRRAWIEIPLGGDSMNVAVVALLTESVD